MTSAEHTDVKLEMEAYDALPPAVRRAFDQAPMKVSGYNTMRLPGFKRAYETMSADEFAATITQHFAQEAARQHAEDRRV